MGEHANVEGTSYAAPAAVRAAAAYKVHRRIRLASMLELSVYILIASLLTMQQYVNAMFSPLGRLGVLTSPNFILPWALIFFVFFFLILTGRTPLVAVALSGRYGQSRVLRYGDIFFDEIRRANTLAEAAPTPEGENAASSVSTPPRSQPDPFADVERNFATYIARSQDAARIAQRRPNALLFVGTIVAAAGLIFFVITLPGSRYAILDTHGPVTSTESWALFIQLLPRLLMLLFIQVLAGFFLRQYRSSMEDFRYYESVLRHREAEYLSYTLRRKLDDKRALLKFADEIMKSREFGQLLKGQSTSALEAQKAELNEFASFYERFAHLFARAEKATKSKSKATSHA